MNVEATIDSIEEDFAICEDENENVHFIEKIKLPDGAKEGYVVTIFNDGTVVINEEKTKMRRQEILELQEKLFKKE